MNTTNLPTVAVSWGELIDKLTILEIKSERITQPDARLNVNREKALLAQIASPTIAALNDVQQLTHALRQVNQALWEIEDRIRDKELAQEFDEEFIALARSVYITNDQRAALKRDINVVLQSALVEEKSYNNYKKGDEPNEI